MPEFSTYECEQCGEQFKAVDGANAAANGYCSPACESAGKGL
jgi:predicted nucleic acid-binding Zn ribbon protein